MELIYKITYKKFIGLSFFGTAKYKKAEMYCLNEIAVKDFILEHRGSDKDFTINDIYARK